MPTLYVVKPIHKQLREGREPTSSFKITKYIVSFFRGKETLKKFHVKGISETEPEFKRMSPLVNTEESFELISKDSVKDTIFLQSHVII